MVKNSINHSVKYLARSSEIKFLLVRKVSSILNSNGEKKLAWKKISI